MRVKTREEFLAAGWSESSMGSFWKAKEPISYIAEMWERSLRLTPEDLENIRKLPWYNCKGAYSWTLAMFTEVEQRPPAAKLRLKTADELLLSGWTTGPEGCIYTPPSTSNHTLSVTPRMFRDWESLLTIDELAILAKGDDGTRINAQMDYSWTRDMFTWDFGTIEDQAKVIASIFGVKDCECHKEKFNFSFHERWCPDYRHAFDVTPALAMEVKPEDHKTEWDKGGFP